MRVLALALVSVLGGSIAARAEDAAQVDSRLVAPPTPANPRNTEADIVALQDGRLLLIYSRFRDGTEDAATADLYGMHSKDGGHTWGEPFLVVANDAKQNVMSVSLLRLQSGALLLGYLRKNSDQDCRYVVRHSTDEGRTWGPEVAVTSPVSYFVVNNDRIVQLKSGRLLVPAADHGDVSKWPNSPAVCFLSDDEGRTWRRGSGEVRLGGIGCQEPGVIELKDGRVYMILRNSFGAIYRALSDDGGQTWGEPTSTGLIAPESPASIARVPSTGDLLMIWNHSKTQRVPLSTALSADDGQTWGQPRNLESKGTSFAYTSITWVKDTAVLSYWTQSKAGLGLNVAVVPISWFYGKP